MQGHLRVAIADDDGVCREFLRRVLGKLGHDVVCQSENGRKLADYCLHSPPDLVITDVEMPELDGISAAAEICWQCDTPIVLLSGSDIPAHVASLNHVSVLVRRSKPISGAEIPALLAEVAALVGAAGAAV